MLSKKIRPIFRRFQNTISNSNSNFHRLKATDSISSNAIDNHEQKTDLKSLQDKKYSAIQIQVEKRTIENKEKIAYTSKITKDDLEWQKPWGEKEKIHYTFLRTFYSESNHTEILKLLTDKIDFSPAAIRKWYQRKVIEKEVIMQGYIPERVQILGNELAAAHFIVFRGGAVKFFGEDKWIKADKHGEFDLPNRFVDDKILQGIDCYEMNLHYEGLVNLRNLRQVEWLSFNSCKYIDDWCLDTICNIFSDSLIYLDLRNCPNVTYRGLGALHRIKTLKILYLDSMYKGMEQEMTCIMLQDLLPDLEIRNEDD